MGVGRNQVPDQLKVMTEADQMGSAARMMQETVVEPFAVTNPVPRQIKGDARNNDQISFIGMVIGSGRARLQNAECTFLQFLYPFDTAKHHLLAADRRIQYPLPRLKCRRQNQTGICFVMGRGIQCHTFRLSILIKRKQIELRCMA